MACPPESKEEETESLLVSELQALRTEINILKSINDETVKEKDGKIKELLAKNTTQDRLINQLKFKV